MADNQPKPKGKPKSKVNPLKKSVNRDDQSKEPIKDKVPESTKIYIGDVSKIIDDQPRIQAAQMGKIKTKSKVVPLKKPVNQDGKDKKPLQYKVPGPSSTKIYIGEVPAMIKGHSEIHAEEKESAVTDTVKQPETLENEPQTHEVEIKKPRQTSMTIDPRPNPVKRDKRGKQIETEKPKVKSMTIPLKKPMSLDAKRKKPMKDKVPEPADEPPKIDTGSVPEVIEDQPQIHGEEIKKPKLKSKEVLIKKLIKRDDSKSKKPAQDKTSEPKEESTLTDTVKSTDIVEDESQTHEPEIKKSKPTSLTIDPLQTQRLVKRDKRGKQPEIKKAKVKSKLNLVSAPIKQDDNDKGKISEEVTPPKMLEESSTPETNLKPLDDQNEEQEKILEKVISPKRGDIVKKALPPGTLKEEAGTAGKARRKTLKEPSVEPPPAKKPKIKKDKVGVEGGKKTPSASKVRSARTFTPVSVPNIEPGNKDSKATALSQASSTKSIRKAKYRARRNWRKLVVGSRRQREAQSQGKPTKVERSENEVPEKRKKKTCFQKFMNFFKTTEGEEATDSSDEEEVHTIQRRLDRFKTKRQLQGGTTLVGAEEPDADDYGPTKYEKAKKLVKASRKVADHRLGLALNKDQTAAPKADPLQLTNASNATDYKTWVKDAHGALPSRNAVPSDSPTIDLFAQLVPLLKRSSAGKQDDAEAAIEEFRARKLSLQRKQSITTQGSVASQASSPSQHQDIDVRHIAGHLAQRREVRQEILDAKEAGAGKRVLYVKIKQRIGEYTLRLQRIYRDFSNNIEIWHDVIHQIDGQFGVGASTYFRWLRIILAINYLYFFLSVFLIGLPNWLSDEESLNNDTHRTSDLFLAEGYFSKSGLFHGISYSAERRDGGFSFTAYAFIIVLFLIFIINSVFIISRLRGYLKHSLTKIEGSEKKAENLRIILCAWDFSTVDKEAADAQHRSIARDFRLLLRNDNEKLKILEAEQGVLNTFINRWFGKYASRTLHWVFNFLVLILSISFAYATWELQDLRSGEKREVVMINKRSFLDAASSSVISVSTSVFTVLCVWATNSEQWTNIPQKIHVLLGRVGFWYISVAAAVYIFWLQEGDQIAELHPNRCWEGEFGNELYRIVVLEFICNTLLSISTDYAWPKLLKILKHDRAKPEFRVEANMINLVFVHTLSGIGAFFSPFLSLIVIVRLTITFYWKKKIIFETCGYPQHQFHASEIFTPYLVSFFVSYLLVTNANAWIISEAVPSQDCGPFRNASKISDIFVRMNEGAVTGFFQFVVTPAFVYCFLCFLCAIIYTFRASAQAYFKTSVVFNELLQLERLDRDFLLKAIFNIAQAHAKRNAEIAAHRSDRKRKFALIDVEAEIQEAAKDTLKPGQTKGGHGFKTKAKFISQFIPKQSDLSIAMQATDATITSKTSSRVGIGKSTTRQSVMSLLRPNAVPSKTTPKNKTQKLELTKLSIKKSVSRTATGTTASSVSTDVSNVVVTPVGLRANSTDDNLLLQRGQKVYGGGQRRLSLSAAMYYDTLQKPTKSKRTAKQKPSTKSVNTKK